MIRAVIKIPTIYQTGEFLNLISSKNKYIDEINKLNVFYNIITFYLFNKNNVT